MHSLISSQVTLCIFGGTNVASAKEDVAVVETERVFVSIEANTSVANNFEVSGVVRAREANSIFIASSIFSLQLSVLVANLSMNLRQ